MTNINDKEYLYHPVPGETTRQTVERNYYKYVAPQNQTPTPWSKYAAQPQTSENTWDKIKNVYNTYKKQGVYGVGQQYAEPSVQRALQAKAEIEPLNISDVNKHQYISCTGSTDGALAMAETLAGGLYKEIIDTTNKMMNSQQRKSYGGVSGVLADAQKDLINDVTGSVIGYNLGKYNIPQACNILLTHPAKFRK